MASRSVRALLDEEAYRAMQNELLAWPDKGDVMPGCGGLRKLRVADVRRQKGRRGGARVIYLHIPEAERIDLLAIYGQDQRDDLDDDQRRALRALAEQARSEAIADFRRRRPAR